MDAERPIEAERLVHPLPGRPMNLSRMLATWVAVSLRRPRLVLVTTAALALASVLYARDNLGLNTDTADMISADPEWRQTYIELKEMFPQLVDTMLIVVDGGTPDIADRASRRLAGALGGETALVEWAMRPDALPFFERNALLYFTPGELDAVSSRLAEVQPFLGTLAAEPDLAGFAKLLERASTASESDRGRVDLAPGPRRDRRRGGGRTRGAILRSVMADSARGRRGPARFDAALRHRQAETRLP